ncbi:MAG: hypothetical protein KBG84_15345, partial [Planctomycetes bacterium]|nr:hypothetical protein [Planctomycetota bacterium]
CSRLAVRERQAANRERRTMAITYLIDLDCPVKQAVRPAKMLRLLYQRERANEAVNKARRKDASVKPEQVKLRVPVAVKSGKPQLADTTAGEVLSRFSELEALSHHCRECPARALPMAFGCRGEIEFPVSLRAEAWLMGLVHGAAGDPVPRMLLNYMASNGIVGNRVAEMRRTPGIFFESKKALTRRYETGEKLSINQLFELLFLTEKISSGHARFLLGLFELYEGNLPLDGRVQDFSGLRVFEKRDAGALVSRAGVKALAEPADDRAVREIKEFFQAMFLAHELGVSLSVSI